MKDKISCIITDDEPYARKGLQGYVEKIDFLDLKATCEDALELSTVLSIQPVDLLLLDIQMPHITGIDFLKTIAKPPKVILTTAYEQYAIQGFDLDVMDYLLKPISFERFLKAANKARDYFNSMHLLDQPAPYVFLKVEGKLEKISFEDILFISGLENYIVIQMQGKRIITHSTIKSLLDKLPAGKFVQTHKSFIVAVDKVTAIDGNTLRIQKHEVPVSRSLRDSVMQVLLR
ncbi:MAG: DNA-binding response regulator [Pedobacter sp.]|jgi:two-component system LytT family response regulator|nr:DNA-binding response regulator [Pedobacter sp.]